jgi:predicted PurR-regulated permease PerM
MTQRQLFILAFFVFLILIFLQLIGVFKLFLIPILWAIILTIVFFPLHKKFLKLFKNRKTLAALMTLLVVFTVTVGPMVFFSGTLVREILQFYATVGEWISDRKYEVVWNRLLDSPLRIIWDKIVEKTSSLDIEIVPLLGRSAQKMSEAIVGQIQSGAKNFLFFVLNYFITIIIFFFFVRDGEDMARGLKDLFPMTPENKEAVFNRLEVTVSAVVRGLVVTGGVQAVLAGIAFWILGVPFPVFLALLIAFLALVPIGGAVVVWAPSAVYLYFAGHWGKALILFLWGALVISTVDNFLKPLLIGEKTHIPTLFLFLAILGGMSFYGLIGVFLGPAMLALFLTLIDIYRKEYSHSEKA